MGVLTYCIWTLGNFHQCMSPPVPPKYSDLSGVAHEPQLDITRRSKLVSQRPRAHHNITTSWHVPKRKTTLHVHLHGKAAISTRVPHGHHLAPRDSGRRAPRCYSKAGEHVTHTDKTNAFVGPARAAPGHQYSPNVWSLKIPWYQTLDLGRRLETGCPRKAIQSDVCLPPRQRN